MVPRSESAVSDGRGGVAMAVARLVDRAIVWSSSVVAVLATAALFVSIGLEVIVRYATSRSLGWTTEMPNLLFPWMTMAGIVLAAQFGRHIVVELGVRQLPGPAARVVLVLLQVPIAVVFAYLAWTGLTILQVTSGERFPVTRIAAYWAYLAIVVGFSLLAVTAVTTAMRLAFDADDPFAARNDDAIGGAE